MLTTVYRFDTHGYYFETCEVMDDPKTGLLLLPPDCVTFAPSDNGLWARINDAHNAWTYEPVPTREQLLGVTVRNDDMSAHAERLRELMKRYADGKEWLLDYGADARTLTKKAPPTFEQVKARKTEELENAVRRFDNELVNNDMVVRSSVGFDINADLRSQNNIRGLQAAGIEPVVFMDAHNEPHQVTQADLAIMLKDTVRLGSFLYQTKWRLRAAIESATTIDELNAIEIKFDMAEF